LEIVAVNHDTASATVVHAGAVTAIEPPAAASRTFVLVTVHPNAATVAIAKQQAKRRSGNIYRYVVALLYPIVEPASLHVESHTRRCGDQRTPGNQL
jgi:hypothetical protein